MQLESELGIVCNSSECTYTLECLAVDPKNWEMVLYSFLFCPVYNRHIENLKSTLFVYNLYTQNIINCFPYTL